MVAGVVGRGNDVFEDVLSALPHVLAVPVHARIIVVLETRVINGHAVIEVPLGLRHIAKWNVPLYQVIIHVIWLEFII